MFRYRLILAVVVVLATTDVYGSEPDRKPPAAPPSYAAALKELGEKPGAKEFLAVTGVSEASLNLFRDILASPNRELFEALGKGRELAILIDARKTKVFGASVAKLPRNAEAPTIVDIAAIYFAESTMPERKVGERPTYETKLRLMLPALTASFKGGPEREAVAAILGKWAGTRSESATLYHATFPLLQLRPELAVIAAVRTLEVEKDNGFHRSVAIATIGGQSGANRLALLLPLLKDDGILYEDSKIAVGGNHHEIRTRDFALGILITLTEQRVQDYGLSRQGAGGVFGKFGMTEFYFAGDEKAKKREAAFVKWDAWYEKNKDKFTK
jgi:hypothetical protein